MMYNDNEDYISSFFDNSNNKHSLYQSQSDGVHYSQICESGITNSVDLIGKYAGVHIINNNKEENINMSITYTQILKDGIIILADSRSTKFNNGKAEYDDEYQKIYYSKNFEVGLVSSGLNEFGGKNLVEFSKHVESSCKDLLDFKNKLVLGVSYYAQLYNVACGLAFAFYESSKFDEKFPTIQAIDAYPNGEIKNGIYSHFVGDVNLMGFSGRSFLHDNNFRAEPFLAKNQAVLIKEKITNLIEFTQKYSTPNQSVIGGEVKTLILHPDGNVEWL